MTARVINSVHNVDTGLNYLTIQAAIDANETLDGHTIVVDAGNHTENVDVYKPLSIFGAGVANAMIYAYNPNDHVFYVTANNVTIQAFIRLVAISCRLGLHRL